MNLVMCTGCGEFVRAAPDGDELVPVNRQSCRYCGGSEFTQVTE